MDKNCGGFIMKYEIWRKIIYCGRLKGLDRCGQAPFDGVLYIIPHTAGIFNHSA